MESTIQGLLDFARPPELHRVAHDLRTTVQRALNLVEGRAKQQDVAISERIPNSPVVVSGDPEQLHQIFVNLLLNGIEAMPQGGPVDRGRGSRRTGANLPRFRLRFGGWHPTSRFSRGFSSRLPPARSTAPGWGWRSVIVSPRNTAACCWRPIERRAEPCSLWSYP